MGNDTSTQSWLRSGASAIQDASSRSKKGLLSKWKKRHLEAPLFGVVRHAERADGIYAFYEDGRWTGSEDYFRWPLDPPLSDAGHTEADGLGDHIRDFAKRKGSMFHVIISSPYLRCVQTAVKICKKQGPGVKILLDHSFGEVCGPSVMGEVQPQIYLRPFEEARKYCRSHGVDCVSCAVGKQPVWPETLKDARARYALSFLSYLRRASVAKRNFLIVTHGDCIGTVMGILPDQKHSKVTKVDYGAAILASRAGKCASSALSSHTDAKSPNAESSAGPYSSVLPIASPQWDVSLGPDSADVFSRKLLQELQESLPGLSEDVGTDQAWGSPADGARRGALLPEFEEACHSRSPKRRFSETSVSENSKCRDEHRALQGWRCETSNLELEQKYSSNSKFARRLSKLLELGPYTRDKIENLLGELGDLPLGDSSMQSHESHEVQRSRSIYSGSHLSAATYLFGGSDLGSPLDGPSPAASSSLGPSGTGSGPISPEDYSNTSDCDALLMPDQESLLPSPGSCSPGRRPHARPSCKRKSGRLRSLPIQVGKGIQENASMHTADCTPRRSESGQISQLGPKTEQVMRLPGEVGINPVAEQEKSKHVVTEGSASRVVEQCLKGPGQSSLMQRRKQQLPPIKLHAC